MFLIILNESNDIESMIVNIFYLILYYNQRLIRLEKCYQPRENEWMKQTTTKINNQNMYTNYTRFSTICTLHIHFNTSLTIINRWFFRAISLLRIFSDEMFKTTLILIALLQLIVALNPAKPHNYYPRETFSLTIIWYFICRFREVSVPKNVSFSIFQYVQRL